MDTPTEYERLPGYPDEEGIEWSAVDADRIPGHLVWYGRLSLAGLVAVAPPGPGCPWMAISAPGADTTSYFQLVESG